MIGLLTLTQPPINHLRNLHRTLKWVDEVCEFDFVRVIPAHLNNDVKASAKDFYDAFEPLRSDPGVSGGIRKSKVKDEDLALLQEASDRFTKLGIVAPSKVCDLEEARVIGRFKRQT